MLHHQKHHLTYIENLNLAEEKFAEAQSKGDLDTMILIGHLIKFNGGGHLNHSLLWTILAPKGTSEPQGLRLLDRFNRIYLIWKSLF